MGEKVKKIDPTLMLQQRYEHTRPVSGATRYRSEHTTPALLSTLLESLMPCKGLHQ